MLKTFLSLVPRPLRGRLVTDSIDVTGLLAEARTGDRAAADRLVMAVYPELHRIAERCLRGERRDHTLQPTALVNEAYLKLIDQHRSNWQNRAQFFAVAATLMRRILVDYARAQRAAKRGGVATRVTLDDAHLASHHREVDVIALDDALRDLESTDPRASRLVELKFFAGLTTRETAEVLGVSVTRVEREWASTRAWLFRAISNLESV